MGKKGVRKNPKIKSDPKKMITCDEMEVALANHFDIRRNIIVPNVSWGFFDKHEADMLVIRNSGYAFEIEIKRSRADMKADFKKKHGHIDKKNRIVQLYYAFPKELLPKVEELVPLECGIITVEKYPNSAATGYVKIHREATRKKGAKKLTQKEQFKIARLGTLRIWSLKTKLNNLKYKYEKDIKSKV